MPHMPDLPDLPDLPDMFGGDQQDEPALVDEMDELDDAGAPPPPGAAVGEGGGDAPPPAGAEGGELGEAPPVPPGVGGDAPGEVGNPVDAEPGPVELPVDEAPVEPPVIEPVEPVIDPVEPPVIEPVEPPVIEPVEPVEPVEPPAVEHPAEPISLPVEPEAPATPLPEPVVSAVSGGGSFADVTSALGDALGAPGAPAPDFSFAAPPAPGEATLLLPDSPDLPALQVTGTEGGQLTASPLDGGPPMSFPMGDVLAAQSESGQDPVSFSAPAGGFAAGAVAGALTGLTAVAVATRRLRRG